MNIKTTTNFSAGLASSDAENSLDYAQFSGSVDADGKPSVSFYINDMTTYKTHVAEFKVAWEEFQKKVFDYSNDMLNIETEVV